MKCSKCKKDFEESELQESHDVPAYIFDGDRPRRKKQADKFGRTKLCETCHKTYEKNILKILVLNLYHLDEEINEDNLLPWMKKVYRKCTSQKLRERAIKICIKVSEEWLK